MNIKKTYKKIHPKLVKIVSIFLVIVLAHQSFLFLVNPTYAAPSPWTQTDWSGGVGASTATQYSSASNINATTVAGQLTLASTEKLSNTSFETASDPFSATGGTVTTSGGNTIHTFTSSGTFTANGTGNVEYLVVGGGGGGGQIAGGGGAGGFRTATGFAVTANVPITVTVGAGGAAGASGNNSVFGTITSSGGGAGGGFDTNGSAGGSGGGGGGSDTITPTGGAGNSGGYSPVEGRAGGTGGASRRSGGGGGGAGAVGVADNAGNAGNGGVGVSSSITGSAIFYSGGGGGGADTGSGGVSRGVGGSGGGGNGELRLENNSTAGTVNTGGGGGGGAGARGVAWGNPKAGGSGIVIVRYPTPIVLSSWSSSSSPSATGGTVTTFGGNIIHTFTSSGTFTANGTGNVEYLVVGGGGGGGQIAGGGGAGGFRTATGFAVAAGTAITVTVGAGGAANAKGNNSVFGTITSTGGGIGGGFDSVGGPGGSGGGGGGTDTLAALAGGAGNQGAYTPVEGRAGGSGGASKRVGGGGGGAGGAGANENAGNAGAGGAGLESSITGSAIFYAGGGGAGADTSVGGVSRGLGGSGGGGNGELRLENNSTAGTVNTGGGGGGGAGARGVAWGNPKAGGSGIVIVRYPTLTATRDTGIKYAGTASAKLVVSNIASNFTQSVNVGDTGAYNLITYAYTTGAAVTSADAELFYNGAVIATTYALVGNGWYKLSGTLTGANASRDYGVQVKANKTVYVDDFSLNILASSGTLTSNIFDSNPSGNNWGILNYTATLSDTEKLSNTGFETNLSSWTSSSFSATGGTITTSGGYTIHTFTSNGTFTANGTGNVEYLVVGGGGGSGYSTGAPSSGGGGGGAGGFRTNVAGATSGANSAAEPALILSSGPYSVTVGGGGGGGVNGGNSAFHTITSIGGGYGANVNISGTNGGSGGGARFGPCCWVVSTPTVGTVNQGTAGMGGGDGHWMGWHCTVASGWQPFYWRTTTVGGSGGGAASTDGTGLYSSISGTSVGYAGGGQGSGYAEGQNSADCGPGHTYPAGGSWIQRGSGVPFGGGAGGTGGVGVAGAPNRGGGGGSGNGSTAAGGSGIVIIRYLPSDLTATRDTTTKYAGTASAKLVTGGGSSNFIQSVNVGDTGAYNLITYAYTTGVAVTSADAELFYNGAVIATTYALVGNGWYKLSGTLTGANASRDYGVQVKANKTVYTDDFSLKSFAAQMIVKARTSNSATMVGATAFSSCTAITSGADISTNNCVIDTHRYIQYQINLTPIGSNTPIFQDISIAFAVGEVYLISSTLDTGFTKGVNYLSIMWKGALGTGGTNSVTFQFAASNCAGGQTNNPTCNTGAWAYLGPGGSTSTYYTTSGPNSPVPLNTVYSKGMRYYRYKIFLQRVDPATSPTVTDVIVNWSP